MADNKDLFNEIGLEKKKDLLDGRSKLLPS